MQGFAYRDGNALQKKKKKRKEEKKEKKFSNRDREAWSV